MSRLRFAERPHGPATLRPRVHPPARLQLSVQRHADRDQQHQGGGGGVPGLLLRPPGGPLLHVSAGNSPETGDARWIDSLIIYFWLRDHTEAHFNLFFGWSCAWKVCRGLLPQRAAMFFGLDLPRLEPVCQVWTHSGFMKHLSQLPMGEHEEKCLRYWKAVWMAAASKTTIQPFGTCCGRYATEVDASITCLRVLSKPFVISVRMLDCTGEKQNAQL